MDSQTKIRGRIRSNFRTTVDISTDSINLTGCNSKNISLNGIFIESKIKPPNKTVCRIKITLDNEITCSINFQLKGIVIRSNDDGFAINFTEMDIDTFQHLKNILQYNTEDPAEFHKQNKTKIGFK